MEHGKSARRTKAAGSGKGTLGDTDFARGRSQNAIIFGKQASVEVKDAILSLGKVVTRQRDLFF